MEPTIDTTAPEETPAEEPSDGVLGGSGADLNAIEPSTEVAINIEEAEKNADKDSEGNATDKPLTKGTAAEVIFVDGTTDNDAKALGGDRPVKFVVEPKAGWKADLTVSATVMKDEKPEAATVNKDSDGVYTIQTNQVADDKATPPKQKGYTGDITIKIVAEQVKSTLKLSAALESGNAAYLLNADGTDVDKEKEIKNAYDEGKEIQLSYGESGEEVSFAVTAGEKPAKYNTIKVAFGSEEGKSVSGEVKELGESKYIVYSFVPSEMGSLNKNTDTDITITVEEGKPAKTLTLAAEESADWTLTAVTDALTDDDKNEKVITVKSEDVRAAAEFDASDLDEDNYVEEPAAEEGGTAKKRLLIFGVKLTDANKVKLKGDNPVKAVLMDSGSKTKQTINAEYVAKADTKGGYYKISLADIESKHFADGNLTLTVKVETEPDDTKTGADGVHKMTFEGDLGNVEIYSVSDDNKVEKLATPYTGKAKKLNFAIVPKAGYALAEGTDYRDEAEGGTSGEKVVNVTYTKRYELSKKKTGETREGEDAEKIIATVDVTVPEEVVLEKDESFTVGEVTVTAYTNDYDFEPADKKDKDWQKADGVTVGDIDTTSGEEIGYTIENVKVAVKTVFNEHTAGTVTVVSEDASFQVEGEGITPIGNDRYEISEDATLLKLTVASKNEPVVAYSTNKKAVVTGAEGTFTAEIPVSEFATKDGTIDDTINIKITARNLTIKSRTGQEEEAAFAGQVEINGEKVENFTGIIDTLSDGAVYSVKLTAPTGTEFVKVSATSAAEGAQATDLTLDENDKSVVSFQLTMDNDYKVDAVLKSVYAATVSVGSDKIEKGEDGIYAIPTGSTGIKVALVNGEQEEDLLYARIYDGNKIAKTTADISGNVATIKSIAEDDTDVLRVDLAPKATKKVVMSVLIRQDKPASALAVKDEKGKSVNAAALMTDSAVSYFVEATAGRLDYANTIAVEVVDEKDAAGVDNAPTKNAAVEAVFTKSKDGKTGTLKITALPGAEGKKDAAFVRLYDTAVRKDVLAKKEGVAAGAEILAEAIAVETKAPSIIGQAPTVKEATGSDKAIRVELSTSDKIVEPLTNDVYYQVTIDGALSEGIEKVQYFKKTKYEKNNTQLATIEVYKPTKDQPNGSKNPYTVTVELVQTTKGTVTDGVKTTDAAAEGKASPSTLISSGKPSKAVTTSTRDALYETKLKMKPTSATVYTGQGFLNVAQAQFDKNTGFTTAPYVQFVDTKTGVLLGDRSDEAVNQDGSKTGIAVYENYQAKVDGNGNISVKNTQNCLSYNVLKKNIGLKVTAEYPRSDTSEYAYASTAILKLNTVYGIQNIDFVSGATRNLFYEGKKATLKLTPVLNNGDKTRAPKGKALTYALAENTSSEVRSYVTVNAKNGTVSVAANWDLNGQTKTFTVVAKAADHSGNDGSTGTRTKNITVNVSGSKQSLGNAVVVDSTNKVIAKEGGDLNAADFYQKELYVKVLKAGMPDKRQYTANDFVNTGLTYASGTKASLDVDTASGKLTFLKPNAKAVKLTVKAADGSKNNQSILNVNVKGYEALGLVIDGDEGNNGNNPDVKTVYYDGATNAKFDLDTVVKANNKWLWTKGEDNSSYQDPVNYTNLSVKVTGAKVINKPKDGVDWMTIVMASGDAKIEITDKTDKSKKYEYHIIQQPPVAKSAKAPSIKQIGKLTADDVKTAQTKAEGKDIAFQVKDKDTNNQARQYVFLIPDYTKGKYMDHYGYEYERAGKYFLGSSKAMIKQIDDKGQFSLNLNLNGADDYDIIPGSYSLIATIGTYENGQFVPATKGTTLKIAIPGKAPKNSLTVKGKYTLDASATAPVSLDDGKNIVTDYDWKLTNEPGKDGNYAMNLIDKSGKPNKFNEYFEVKAVTEKNEDGEDIITGYTLGLKPGLEETKIADIMTKEHKADCEGYVTVTSYMVDKYGTENLQTKDMKITVSFKNAKLVAKTDYASAYQGTTATVRVFKDAKSQDEIVLAGAAIVPDEKNGGVTFAASSEKTGVEADGKSIKLNLASAAPGSYKVKLKVLVKDSAYAAMSGDKAKDPKALAASDIGREVTAAIKVSGPDAGTKNKVVVKDKNLRVAATDSTYKDGVYTLFVNVANAVEGAEIDATAAIEETWKNKPFAGKTFMDMKPKYDKATGKLTLTFKRDEMLAASVADETKGQVKLGKALDIPVTFSFKGSNSVNVEKETTVLKVTLPSPMTVAQWQDTKNKKTESRYNLEQMLNAMSADLLFSADAGVKNDLQERINEAIKTAIPLDLQAAEVSRTPALAEVKGTGDTKDKIVSYETTVTIKEKKDDKELVYNTKFSFTNAADGIATEASTLKTTIEALTAESLELTNAVESENLVSKVTAALAKQKPAVKISSNLLLTVTSFKKKNATMKSTGTLTATISIRDRKTGIAIEAEIGNPKALEIQKLENLGEAKKSVEEALANKKDDKGIDYAEIIVKTLENATDLTGLEDALEKVIKEAAKKAIKNETITPGDFVKVMATKTSSDNPAAAEKDADVDVDFKLPTASEDGFVAFKLKLTQEGMKDLIVDMSGEKKITLAKANDKFQTLTEAETEVKKLGTVSSDVLSLTDEIYGRTAAEVESEVKKLVDEEITGVGLAAEVSCTGFKESSTRAGEEILPNEENEVTAVGTITLKDNLGREEKKEISFSATVPKIEKTLGNMTITATKDGKEVTIGNNAFEVTADDVKTDSKWVFDLKFEGSTWLDAADKAATWTVVEKVNADSNGKLADIPTKDCPAGVTFDAATRTLTISDAEKITKDATVILRAVRTGEKISESEQETDNVKFVTVTLKAPAKDESGG